MIWISFAFFQNQSVKIRFDIYSLKLFLLRSLLNSRHSFVVHIISLQEIHSLPTKIIDGLNSVGNYRRNNDGTKHIIFSTFLLPFIDRIPKENYRRKCSVGNFRTVCRRQLLGTIYRQNTY